jgi:flagellar biosynthesis protein
MTDSEKKAVALRYGEEDAAPKILASGSGYLAERIEALAREHGIPAVKNTLLIDLLSILEPGTTIPSDAYRLVAEILAFLYRTDIRFRESHRFMG